MTPEISEFSYGFALTNELIDLAGAPLRAAPVFPSLIAEGRAGGGYDVNLSIPGFPLFLQFKRSECMRRGNAREFSSGHFGSPPVYRMHITEKARSAQHELLLTLDNGSNEVFYVAPIFHKVAELDAAYRNKDVAYRSFCIRPRDIGPLDDQRHHVSFNRSKHVVFSEPREVNGFTGDILIKEWVSRLRQENFAFGNGPLRDAAENMERVLSLLDETSSFDLELQLGSVDDFGDESSMSLAQQKQALQYLADASLRIFGCQFFVVQFAD